jgi:hypothetical protein
MQGQDRPQHAQAHGHGHEAPKNEEQPSAKPGVVAPTEDELRKAKDVIARAKQTGVKLAPGAGGGQARIMLPNGESRSAYIDRRWKEGASRPDIVAEIKSCGGEHEKCSYQVVFSQTKGKPGGPQGSATSSEPKKYTLVGGPEKEAAE